MPWSAIHWSTIHWMAGSILALAWFSRIVDAALGMPRVADIARPEWDRRPATPNGVPRVSIIVPARNEEEHIRETLVQLLALDYSNYEIIAVNDRSTDRTGPIMDEVAASAAKEAAEKVVSEREQCPQRLKPDLIQSTYRSAEALRHPKTTATESFSATSRAVGAERVSCSGEPLRHPKACANPKPDPIEDADVRMHADADRNVRATRLKVIHILELPAGWLGKTHAMWTAGQQASGDWLLFTDADVRFKPDSLRRAISYAGAERADHVVLFPRMITKRWGEKMMIAFFQALFVFAHRPWKVADPKARDHMGVGAFNLLRRSVYDAIGSYRALRMEVLDDMKLGKVVKNAGFAQRNVFGEDLISLRWAKGAFGIVNNLTKNFFAVLSFQWPRTVACIAGLAFLNLGPFLGVWLAQGWARVPYAIALASLFLIYYGMSARSAVPAYYFVLHPLSTSLFMYTLLRSMCHTLANGGIVWRGTKYPLEELRKGMV